MTGVMTLDEATLGTLELSCANGYNVVGFDLGIPEVRKVTRPRALAHGTYDDTTYLGSRVCSVSVTINQNVADPQSLIDAVGRYHNLRLRPNLTWSIPGSSQERQFRGMSPRGFPQEIAGPKYHATVFQWEVPDGRIVAPVEQSFVLNPSSDTEAGRTYPENYADGGRGPYPPSAGLGGRIVTNAGGLEADWRGQLFGPAVNPSLQIGGFTVNFNASGGVTLVAGEYLLIDTFARTIILNGDPLLSRFNKTNFTAWSWPSIRLRYGSTPVRVAAASGTPSALFSFRSTWQ